MIENEKKIKFDEEEFDAIFGNTTEETKILQSARVLMETKLKFNPIPELLAGIRLQVVCVGGGRDVCVREFVCVECFQ